MRFLYCFLLLLLSTLGSIAQNSSRTFYFYKEIPMDQYAGKPFRFEIAVQTNAAPALALEARSLAGQEEEKLVTRIEKREEQDWIIYTVSGTLGDHAGALRIYHFIDRNGDFYFDDLNCYVETQPGHWAQLSLDNPSFEATNPNGLSGYTSNHPRFLCNMSISHEVYKTGQHSFFVKAFGFRQSAVVPTEVL